MAKTREAVNVDETLRPETITKMSSVRDAYAKTCKPEKVPVENRPFCWTHREHMTWRGSWVCIACNPLFRKESR